MCWAQEDQRDAHYLKPEADVCGLGTRAKDSDEGGRGGFLVFCVAFENGLQERPWLDAVRGRDLQERALRLGFENRTATATIQDLQERAWPEDRTQSLATRSGAGARRDLEWQEPQALDG